MNLTEGSVFIGGLRIFYVHRLISSPSYMITAVEKLPTTLRWSSGGTLRSPLGFIIARLRAVHGRADVWVMSMKYLGKCSNPSHFAMLQC